MLRFINRLYNKIMRLVYRKGYVINFESLENKPDFDDYYLKNIVNWLSTTDNQWICTSEITDKKEFTDLFFELTNLPQEQITIEEGYYPFVLFY